MGRPTDPLSEDAVREGVSALTEYAVQTPDMAVVIVVGVILLWGVAGMIFLLWKLLEP